MKNLPINLKLMTMLSTSWQYFRKLPIIAFSIGVATCNLASHFLTCIEIANLINSSTQLEYEGWIIVKINGFGAVSYDSNFILDYFNSQSGLSRNSKITTTIFTDALPPAEKINRGDIKNIDVSVLTNMDYQGYLKGNKTDKYRKIHSQTFQSQLVAAKESKIPVCLYVGGIRDGNKSTYLNILKIKIPNKKAMAKLASSNSLSKEVSNVSGLCNTKGEPILERSDR
jgi:hypothetical protein